MPTPTKSQLRKRRGSIKATPSKPSPTNESTQSQTILSKLHKPAMLVFKIAFPILFGITTAASFSSTRTAISLFIATIFTVFAALVLTTMSIHREKDQSPVYMPDVHNPDGTVVRQQQMTVFQHDEKTVKYFGRELPAMALAAVWFYLWSLFKPTFALYTAFVAFRILFHPLFRIHLWKEPLSKEIGRPFGAAPLFDDASKVLLVEGDSQLQQLLQSARKDSLVIIDCSATWCAPCKQMAPQFEKLAEEFTQHTFLSVDIDISRDITTNLAITSVPSFVIFKNNQRMEMIKGASPDKLRESIQSYT